MKKILAIVITFFLLLVFVSQTLAYDPTTRPNNKFGIHILNPSEVSDAVKLVNSNGGDWGYITIPVQAGDKDIKKWQDFMDKCKDLHLIPILRLATEGDFFNTTVWRRPEASDVLDFSNFLSSLNWPTQNRYIVVFNEVNRADEWGGTVDPASYANLLTYAVSVFKSKNPDFFIISSGMDNASVNSGLAMNEYTYFSKMNEVVPGIFNQIDGISSHSYPNPGFSMPSSFLNTRTIDTYYYEKKYLETLTSKSLPVFITETGWAADSNSQDRIGTFYQDAFQNVWKDQYLIAITPFIFNAGSDPFKKFSFLDSNGNPNKIYNAYFSIPKTKGSPIISSEKKVLSTKNKNLPIKNFTKSTSIISDRLEKFQKVLQQLFRF